MNATHAQAALLPSSRAQRPHLLEVNSDGAYRRVLGFDANNQQAAALVRKGVQSLATVDPGVTFRITERQSGEVLLNYSVRFGWTEGTR